ncbi:hypothetical protein MAUB1S_06265 [Mycolicibacterium aubagnense]
MDQLEHNSGLVAHSDLTISRVGSLTAIINRIEEAVETETAAIRTDVNFDLRASNARKSRCLYELNRAIKNITAEDLVDEHKEGLLRLRGKLERNEAALLAHLSAVSEVANLMKNAIQHAEADGTYSAGEFGWAKS